jgi:hypothetical protein
MQNRQHDQDIFGPQSNSLGAIGTIGGSSLSHHALNSDILGAIGAGLNLTPSTSPQTSSSTGSNLACGRCDTHASSRCLDCNDILCGDCVEEHRRNNFTREHCLVGLSKFIRHFLTFKILQNFYFQTKYRQSALLLTFPTAHPRTTHSATFTAKF